MSALLAAFVLAFSFTLLGYRQLNPLRPEEGLNILSEEDVWQWIVESDLSDAWDKQSPRWVCYDDVFREQAANYGAVTELNGSFVAWWGVLRIVNNTGERFRSAELVVEGASGTLGKARLPIIPHSAVRLRGAWHDGQVVSILGVLTFTDRSLASPVIHIYDMQPALLQLYCCNNDT